MNGLLGLTKPINTTESALRDLSVLERMDQRIQQDRQAEVTAQKEEQLMYERMYQMSDQLLEKDRNAINKRFQMAQKQIGEHIRMNGGSRKRFMEKGGLSAINTISNDLIRSPEAVQYQENKKNLAKILELKEKGMGHLIAPRDMRSLEEYEKNPNGGKIHYSGVLAEVEIPPSANFDYGTDIPIEKVLSHGSNMMKIKANYEMNYPDRPEPNYLQLVAFAKEMGYGGTGSNTVKMQLAFKQAQAQARAAAQKQARDKTTNSYLSQYNTMRSQMPQKLNIRELNEKYGGDLYGYMKSKNQSIAKLVSDNPTGFISRQRPLDEAGLDWQDILTSERKSNPANPLNWAARLSNWAFKDKLGLKSSYEILPHNKLSIAQRAFELKDENIENGQIKGFNPADQTEMYRMDGVKLTGEYALDADKYKGTYTIKGIVTGLKAKSASEDGQPVLLINAYDDDGKLDEKATKELDEAYGDKENGLGGSEIQTTTLVAIENNDGDLFYKEINIEDPQIKTLFSEQLGADDDITQTIDQDNKSQAMLDMAEQWTSEQELQARTTYNTLNNKQFKDPVFDSESEKYWGYGSGGQQNRDNLMKSFYIALDWSNNFNAKGEDAIDPTQVQKFIDDGYFTQLASLTGIDSDLKEYNKEGRPDEWFINEWVSAMNENLEEGSTGYENNLRLAQKWLQYLKIASQ